MTRKGKERKTQLSKESHLDGISHGVDYLWDWRNLLSAEEEAERDVRNDFKELKNALRKEGLAQKG